jgi:hypothetical protein
MVMFHEDIGAKILTLHALHQLVIVTPSLQGLSSGLCGQSLPPAFILSRTWALDKKKTRPQDGQFANHWHSLI